VKARLTRVVGLALTVIFLVLALQLLHVLFDVVDM